ncbi:MAG: DUF6941 family protein [Devosia sp.]
MKNFGFTTVFCDDVRQETSGKHILIGVYGGELVPGSMPSSFPISLYIKLSDVAPGHHSFRLKISVSNGGHSAEIAGEVDLPASTAVFPMVFAGLPMNVDKYGEIIAELAFDDQPAVVIGKLSVSQPQKQ